MKWEKLGKIFDPTEHILTNSCFAFAKSPQAIIFEEFIRIYFSSVSKDLNGKFLSHVMYVDFTRDFSSLIKVSSHNVIELGELGAFDEHGIFPINVLKTRNKIFAFTTGWSRRKSVSVETSIGLAFSTDNGETFNKFGNGPIVSSSLKEPFLVCDAFVLDIDNTFHMWYIYGINWIKKSKEQEPERVYKIAHAISSDGIIWNRDGINSIPDKLNRNESQALPTVFFHRNKYHMYFCYRESFDFRKNKNNGYKIGYAFSEDLINWQRNDEEGGMHLSSDGWDSEMMCYPHVFHVDNKSYMLYNGNEFGKYGFGLAILEE